MRSYLGGRLVTRQQQSTTVSAVAHIPSVGSARAAALVVIHGRDLGKKYDLSDVPCRIGRAPTSDILVDQDSVSRIHALVSNDQGRVSVRDVGSTNGTFVNDEPIEGEARLRHGDLIRIGRTVFKFLATNDLEAAYHDEIYRLTTLDGLTQVFNRRYFEETLEREVSRCRRYERHLCLVLLDLDHFKKVNDCYGHVAGDAVLKWVANTIRARVRREDVLARFGGEEFSLILPEVELDGARVLAEKTRALVEDTQFRFDGQLIPVTLSAGVASLGKWDDAVQLVSRADERLYEAKNAGRNRVSG